MRNPLAGDDARSTFWTTWMTVCVLVTALCLAESARLSWVLSAEGRGPAWWRLVVSRTPWAVAWMLMALAAIWFAERVRLDSLRNRSRAIAAHCLVGFVIAAAHATVVAIVFFQIVPPAFAGPDLGAFVRRSVQSAIAIDLLTYGSIVGAYYAIDYARRYRQSAIAQAHLERQMVEARVQALQMQLNPHFFFDTLDAVVALIGAEQNAVAVSTIARLGDLVRATLERSGEPETTLGEELSLLQIYLDVQRCRLGSRLSIKIDVQSDLRDAIVPAFWLQGLVDGVLRPGLIRESLKHAVHLSAERTAGRLVVHVRDNGADVGGHGEVIGTALENTSARLAELYDDEGGLRVERLASGGAAVMSWIPFQMIGSDAQVELESAVA